nr:MAG TPA: hypothetical protein [Caudoviricetes sp.]
MLFLGLSRERNKPLKIPIKSPLFRKMGKRKAPLLRYFKKYLYLLI